jgi:hypothetical protein
MVARRKAQKKPPMTDYEAVKLALSKVETISDEEMAAFWGPDWKEREAKISEDIAAGRVEYFDSEEEFLAALEATHAEKLRQDADLCENA